MLGRKKHDLSSDVVGLAVDVDALDGEGDTQTTPMKGRGVEPARELPDILLTYVIEGNLAGIEAMGDQELSPGLRRLIVAGLARVDAENLEADREDLRTG